MSLPVLNPALSLPVPQVLERLGYEPLLAAWLDIFAPLFRERTGEIYDVGTIETDPGVIIAEAFSYLRLTDRQRINEVYAALRLALANDTDLDGLAGDRGVRRLVYAPADPQTGTAAVTERDESLRLRTWLKMQSWGRGSCFGVEYEARTAGLADVADARAYDYPGEGRMLLVLLPDAGRTAPYEPVRARIAKHVMARERRPGAVWIDTVEAKRPVIDVSGTLFLRRGASQAPAISAATQAVSTFMSTRRRIGALVPHARVEAAACIADVVNAHIEPREDIAMAQDEAAELGTVTFAAQIVDD